jgi:hypothetical protein
MAGNLEKRLAQVEKKLAEIANQEALADCICIKGPMRIPMAELEAEMNRPCPRHGLRRMGHIINAVIVSSDRTLTEESRKRSELIEAYERRLAQAEGNDMEQEEQ